jgi:hypothetical protein
MAAAGEQRLDVKKRAIFYPAQCELVHGMGPAFACKA